MAAASILTSSALLHRRVIGVDVLGLYYCAALDSDEAVLRSMARAAKTRRELLATMEAKHTAASSEVQGTRHAQQGSNLVMSDFCTSEMPTPMADHSQQLADGERVQGVGLWVLGFGCWALVLSLAVSTI